MKSLLITFGLSLLLMMILVPLGGMFGSGHEHKLVLAGISYCALSIWRLNKTKSGTIFLTIFFISLPPLLLFIPVYLIGGRETYFSLPSSLFHLIGILVGLLIFESKKRFLKILYGSGLILSGLFMFIWGYDLWIHKLNHGTFTGRIAKPAPTIQFEDESGNLFTNKNFKGKTVVLDFWTTSCGICFAKFPKVEALYNKTKNRKDIVVVSVNNPLKRDTKNHSIEMIRELGYTFEILFADLKISNEKFGFNAYPAVFIINDGKEIIYKGDIENVESVLGL